MGGANVLKIESQRTMSSPATLIYIQTFANSIVLLLYAFNGNALIKGMAKQNFQLVQSCTSFKLRKHMGSSLIERANFLPSVNRIIPTPGSRRIQIDSCHIY